MRNALVILALLGTAASAVVWRHDVDAAATLALAAEHPAVGRVLPDGTATLIAPTWAITAGHVAADLQPGGSLMFGGVAYPVAAIHLHPQGRPDPARPHQPPEVDLALIELAQPVLGVAPLAVHRGRAEQGALARLVGCGDFAPAGTALAHQDGRCRAVTNAVADAGPKRLFFPFDAPPAGSALEGMGAPGDSGGPALIAVDGKWQVAGVSSGSDGKPGAYGSTDIFVRVSSHLEWIDATLSPRQ